MSKSRILVIIPCFNERDNIAQLLHALMKEESQPDVMVVDDGSPDGTEAVVRSVIAEFPERVTLLERSGKGGRGSAVLEGFRHGLKNGYDIVVEMDADFSHNPKELTALLALTDKFDIVVGSRYLPGSRIENWGWKRTFFSKWANVYARMILRMPLSDYTNGYRAYRRRALEALEMENINAKGYVVLSETAYQLFRKGFTIGQMPTHFVNRRRGISNLSGHEIQEAFLSVLRIRWPRAAEHIEQGIKFGFAGLTGAIIDFSLLNYFIWQFKIDPRIGNIFSTLVASVVVFLLNKHVAFRHRSGKVESQVTRFVLVYGLAYVLNVVLTALLITAAVHFLHMEASHLVANISKALAIGLVMCWNYFCLHTFVFPKSKHS